MLKDIVAMSSMVKEMVALASVVGGEGDGGDGVGGEGDGGGGIGGEGAGGDGVGGQPRKRKLQQVVPISDRVRVMKWMMDDALVNGEKGVVVRTIANFPSQFCGEYKVSPL